MTQYVKEATLTNESMQAKLDEMGFGKFQLVQLILTGGIMFSEGSEVIIMSSITTLLTQQWQLSPLLKAFMMSIVFVGFAFGNMLSGYIGDSYGRRGTVLLAYLIMGTFGFLTSLATSAASLMLLRFMVGFGCGTGFPAVYALIPEVCPTTFRGATCAVMIGFMALGELFGGLLVMHIDPTLSLSPKEECSSGGQCSWRDLCRASAIPAFIFLGCSLQLLHETPHFFLAKNKVGELNQLLRKISLWNNTSVSINFANSQVAQEVPSAEVIKPQPTSDTPLVAIRLSADKYASLLKPPHGKVTAFLMTCNFMKDFGLFGLSYMLPQYFQTLKSASAGLLLSMMASLSVPGVILAVILTRSEYGHITCIRWVAITTAMMALGLTLCINGLPGAAFAMMAKMMSMTYWISIVVYNTEAYATRVRNTATGLCTGVGRLGGISAPILFELSHAGGGSFTWFTAFLAMMFVTIGSTAHFFLTKETKGMILDC